jgi:hypothetical protein
LHVYALNKILLSSKALSITIISFSISPKNNYPNRFTIIDNEFLIFNTKICVHNYVFYLYKICDLNLLKPHLGGDPLTTDVFVYMV